ncbi:MAG: CRISPR-associated protein family [Chthoniobacteraceae bacterium]|nr:CRISPR-associated protein family [Chthoniobacteraceae bacterium]
MIAIALEFLSGRCHATAWGSHVNEGVPDWPPAPWRLLRALIATWFHKHPSVERARMEALMAKLAMAAPSFALPAATAGHTRHYMPINVGRNEERTKVFDTFIHVAPGQRLTVLWPVELDADERELLAALLASLNYFGRAESLAEAALLPASAALPQANACPLREDEAVPDREEIVRLLAPMNVEELAAWLATQSVGTEVKKKGKKAKAAPLPESVFEALLSDNGDLKAAGWSQPPGSKWISYLRPEEPFQIAPRRDPKPGVNLPTVARFAIVSAVAPQITEALSLGERFHRALTARSDGAPVFTGCDPGKVARTDGHRHAYYLSECDEQRGEVKFLTIFAREGFNDTARGALESLRKTWGYDGHDLQLILLGLGHPGDFAGTNTEPGQCRAFATAREWISLTPFVPTRHLKTRKNGEPKLDENGLAIGSPTHDLLRLLDTSGFPCPDSVEEMPYLELPNRRLRWLQFQRGRKHGEGAHAGVRGYGFKLTFPTAVTGPIALGYGAHFGLGLFVPIP